MHEIDENFGPGGVRRVSPLDLELSMDLLVNYQ